MKNNQIINLINRYCANKEELDAINTDVAYTILAHGYLFVKPGEDTDNFMRELAECLKIGVEKDVDNYLGKMFEPTPIEDFICFSIAKTALKIARKAFDAQYFEEQCALLDGYEEECDEKLLEKYLYLLNEKQFCDFKNLIDESSALFNIFIDSGELCVEIEANKLCHKIDASVPSVFKEMKAYLEYRKNNPNYYLNYLDKETLTSLLCRKLTKDVILATNMARTLYYTNDCRLIYCYAEMVIILQRIFNIDVYNPDSHEISAKVEV